MLTFISNANHVKPLILPHTIDKCKRLFKLIISNFAHLSLRNNKQLKHFKVLTNLISLYNILSIHTYYLWIKYTLVHVCIDWLKQLLLIYPLYPLLKKYHIQPFKNKFKNKLKNINVHLSQKRLEIEQNRKYRCDMKIYVLFIV